MKKILFFFAFMFFSLQLFAVLPPLYQSLKEIDAIVNHKEIGRYLTSGQMVQKIEKTEEGYLLSTQDITLRVKVNYLPQPMPGPAKFELEFILLRTAE